MDTIFQAITDWLKEMLVSGIMDSLSGMFDAVNQQVADVASQVGTSPAGFSPGVFSMIRNVSESVIIPIAGLILTFIACYELIQLIIDHNNLANFETWVAPFCERKRAAIGSILTEAVVLCIRRDLHSHSLQILPQPIRHVGIIRFPRFYQLFITFPVVFVPIEET